MENKPSIVYVNFSPYDNAGRILDYLISHSDILLHFSYDHLRLKNGRKTNILTVYKNGHIFKKNKIFPLRTPDFLRFFSLPGVAALIFIQTVWYTLKYKLRYKRFDYFLSVNAYTAIVGNILRNLRIVDKTIFWVWDYYPPNHPDWTMRIIRYVYKTFDRPAIVASTYLAFISINLVKIRQIMGEFKKDQKYEIIPIGTNPYQGKIQPKKKLVIGFLGMLKSSQGLELLANSLPHLTNQYPKIKIEIIGSGPEETEIKQKFKKWSKFVKFYGYIESDKEISKIIRKWSAGLATYLPQQYNESYWSDPSKIKCYLSQAVPVITTNVPQFSEEIKSSSAGIVIKYKEDDLVKAICTIIKRPNYYSENALNLAVKYNFNKIYQKFLIHPEDS